MSFAAYVHLPNSIMRIFMRRNRFFHMQRIAFLFFLLLSISFHASAQDDLFGNTGQSEQKVAHKGWIIAANGNYDIPGADMAKRFGGNFRVGPGVLYKTKSNWMFGAKSDFIFGGKVKEDSLMYNIRSADGSFVDQQGQRIGVGIYERGYTIGLQLGKIINFNKSHPDDGLLLMTSAGFIQHRIRIFDRDKTIPQIRGEYVKGYDRLTNGWFIEQFVGYNHFGDNGLINYNIGFDFLAGFTQGRRSFLYDVMRKDDKSRLDILMGIKVGWYIPIFRRKSEEYYFQ